MLVGSPLAIQLRCGSASPCYPRRPSPPACWNTAPADLGPVGPAVRVPVSASLRPRPSPGGGLSTGLHGSWGLTELSPPENESEPDDERRRFLLRRGRLIANNLLSTVQDTTQSHRPPARENPSPVTATATIFPPPSSNSGLPARPGTTEFSGLE